MPANRSKRHGPHRCNTWAELEPVFWSRVDKSSGPDACWPWTLARHNHGYGQMGFRGKVWYAHRLAWRFTHGTIPKGLHVLHRCDNRPCCNPDHLFLGTHRENLDDMVTKGRSPRGASRWNARLTEAQVREILRRADERTSALGHEFGVARQTVRDIIARTTWAWIRAPY